MDLQFTTKHPPLGDEAYLRVARAPRRHRFKGKHRGDIPCPCGCGMTFAGRKHAEQHAADVHPGPRQ